MNPFLTSLMMMSPELTSTFWVNSTRNQRKNYVYLLLEQIFPPKLWLKKRVAEEEWLSLMFFNFFSLMIISFFNKSRDSGHSVCSNPNNWYKCHQITIRIIINNNIIRDLIEF